jgi:hypothetical protein
MPAMRLHLRLATALLLVACAAPEDEAADDRSLCDAARAKLASCSGLPESPPVADCDPELARRLLEAECEAVSSAVAFPKADGAGPLATAACALGFFAACETPACDTAPADDTPRDDADDAAGACGHLLAADDCALCSYYDCREVISQCGDEGYLTGYVGKYCRRYASVTEPRVSPRAAAWLGRVRHCLVDYLEAQVPYDADCETIDRRGTDSHAECYVQTGFCELSPLDWFHIVQSIDLGDAPLRVVLRTAHGCLDRWF